MEADWGMEMWSEDQRKNLPENPVPQPDPRHHMLVRRRVPHLGPQESQALSVPTVLILSRIKAPVPYTYAHNV